MLPNPFLKNRSGIYGIRSLDTGKIYVGRTKCMFSRCKQYVNAYHMDSSKHLNDYLRNAFNKYGMDRFEFFPLEFCEQVGQPEKELQWMDLLHSYDSSIGYNLRRDSDGGMTASPLTSAKISARLKREWASGARDGHAQKLRDKWATDQVRKDNQRVLFSRLKTKWVYDITFPDGAQENGMFYARLKDLKITAAQHVFSTKKTNEAFVKGFKVIRRPANKETS